jgi:tetratricopeptide (TPR) repeat protein
MLPLLIALAVAQEPDPAEVEPIDTSGMDLPTLVAEVRRVHDEGRFITARRLAEELLKRDPDNLTGLYVMGRVQWLSEGNHARAMHYLSRANRIYLEEHDGAEERPWELHSQIMFAMQNVAEETGDYGYQLELMDEYDARFDPPFGVAERGWAHMRQGDMDAARQAAQQGIDSEDLWQQVLGYNTLCAVESEESNRQASLDACLAALEHRRSYGSGALSIAAGNAAGAAVGALDFEQAERLAREATSDDSSVTAWRRMILLLVDQGRTAEAVEALRRLRGAQANQEPSMRDLNRADVDAAFARLLLVAGESERGMAVIDRALTWPDRRGLISTDEEQARGGHALIRLAMRRVAAERQAEAASARGVLARISHFFLRLLPDMGRLGDEGAVRSALADAERLEGTFRIYLDDGLNDTPSWLMGELIDVLGVGVADAALQHARAAEDFPGMEAYYDGVEAEIALRRRRYGDAAALAATAAAGLPPEEVLYRARLAAVEAEAAWRMGDRELAMSQYERVMQLDPGTMRRMSLRLPATVEVRASGGVARRVGKQLRRSRRLRLHKGGFSVSIEGGGDELQVCLRSPLGSLLSCADAPRPAPAEGEESMSDTDYVRHVIARFHDRAFAMPLGLSNVDLNSLDGTTTVAGEAERERMKAILEELE